MKNKKVYYILDKSEIEKVKEIFEKAKEDNLTSEDVKTSKLYASIVIMNFLHFLPASSELMEGIIHNADNYSLFKGALSLLEKYSIVEIHDIIDSLTAMVSSKSLSEAKTRHNLLMLEYECVKDINN